MTIGVFSVSDKKRRRCNTSDKVGVCKVWDCAEEGQKWGVPVPPRWSSKGRQLLLTFDYIAVTSNPNNQSGLSQPNHLEESMLIFRGVRSNFLFSFSNL